MLSALSQNRKYFIITGKIATDCVSQENSFVEIKKQNKDSLVFPIQINGRFRIELEYNTEYKLTFKQSGYTAKTISVNTNIPQEVMIRPTNFSNFMMTVKLFRNDDPENLYSGNLTQQIAYSPVVDEFVKMPALYDVQYVEKGNSAPEHTSLR
jgi:hypothetical protein